jgi:hypothetical protein
MASRHVIRVVDIDGYDCPIIECDACGQRIQGHIGMVILDADGTVRFLHKRTCDDHSLRWMEIDQFLSYLVPNTTEVPP